MLKPLFAKLRSTALPQGAAADDPTTVPVVPGAMALDEIIARAEAVAEENKRLAGRVAELEATLAAAPQPGTVSDALNAAAHAQAATEAASTKAAALERENAELKAKVAELEGERDAARADHSKLVCDIEKQVAARVVELGIRGTPIPEKEAVLTTELTGRDRMAAAYEAQLTKNVPTR